MNDTHRKNRLRHLIATDYGRPADFVSATGISKGRVSQITGSKEPFGEGAARKLAVELGLHEDWFNHEWPTPKEEAKERRTARPTTEKKSANEGAAIYHLPSHGAQQEVNEEKETENGDLVIHQYDVGGGMGRARLLLSDQPGIIKSWRVNHDWLRQNIPTHSGVQNLAIVTGFGPSMIGMYNPGDPLLVDMGCKTVSHDAPYFFRIGEEGYIKLLQRVPEFDGPGFVIRAISKNPDYLPFDISPNNPHFEVLGKVLTVWKSEHF